MVKQTTISQYPKVTSNKSLVTQFVIMNGKKIVQKNFIHKDRLTGRSLNILVGYKVRLLYYNNCFITMGTLSSTGRRLLGIILMALVYELKSNMSYSYFMEMVIK